MAWSTFFMLSSTWSWYHTWWQRTRLKTPLSALLFVWPNKTTPKESIKQCQQDGTAKSATLDSFDLAIFLFLVGYHLHAKPPGEDYHLYMPIHAEHHSLYVCTLYTFKYTYVHIVATHHRMMSQGINLHRLPTSRTGSFPLGVLENQLGVSFYFPTWNKSWREGTQTLNLKTGWWLCFIPEF